MILMERVFECPDCGGTVKERPLMTAGWIDVWMCCQCRRCYRFEPGTKMLYGSMPYTSDDIEIKVVEREIEGMME